MHNHHTNGLSIAFALYFLIMMMRGENSHIMSFIKKKEKVSFLHCSDQRIGTFLFIFFIFFSDHNNIIYIEKKIFFFLFLIYFVFIK